MDFIVEIPPCRPHTDSYTDTRSNQTVPNVHGELFKCGSVLWTGRVFICLAHPSVVIREKKTENKLAPSRTNGGMATRTGYERGTWC